jgi:hypothetical protein
LGCSVSVNDWAEAAVSPASVKIKTDTARKAMPARQKKKTGRSWGQVL